MERRQLPALALISLAVHLAAAAASFTNPVHEHGPDPWVVYSNGFFYYMCTTATDLTIWKSPTLEGLKNAPGKIVWKPEGDVQGLTDLWAPELHRIAGRWYIYFAADRQHQNAQHRIYVVENPSSDPLSGTWTMKGQVSDSTQDWAIDATVFQHNEKLYMVWSGWPAGHDGVQNLYIARMKNPWTISSDRVLISHPELSWETFDDGKHVAVNEGPEVLEHAGKLFLVYSASGCWTDHYVLGMLTATADTDLLNPSSWRKTPQPVLSGSVSAHAVSTGHNGFFQSPDGRQDWIIYHASAASGLGCGAQRSSRAQRFTWKPDGTPNFGVPIPVDQPVLEPTGERAR